MSDISFIKERTLLLEKLESFSQEKQRHYLFKITRETYHFLSMRNLRRASEGVYRSFKVFVEDLCSKIDDSKLDASNKEHLHLQVLAIKVGAKVPIDAFLKNSLLKEFIEVNNLANIFFTTKLTILFHKRKGFFLPIELHQEKTAHLPWSEFVWKETKKGYAVYMEENLLFKTGKSKRLARDFSTLWYGITRYNRRKAATFRPYKHVDPSYHGGGHLLEVLVTWQKGEKFSYLAGTHVSLELKDEDGAIRSVGQDIYDHIRAVPKRGFFRAASRSSIIKTPDDASFYPKNHREIRKIAIPLTKKEHDTIIYLVETDKYNFEGAAALLKGNCVSYVQSLFKRALGYDFIADISAHEIILREYLPTKWEPTLQKMFNKIKKWPRPIQRALYFITPLYLITLGVGILSFISSYYGYNNHREYALYEYLFFPWRIRCDIPIFLYKVLQKHASNSGIIDRSSFPQDFCFD
ncbi:hypothetical protein K0U07_05755 [bacterium]|nr:hypothetical protein [bacterium]